MAHQAVNFAVDCLVLLGIVLLGGIPGLLTGRPLAAAGHNHDDGCWSLGAGSLPQCVLGRNKDIGVLRVLA